MPPPRHASDSSSLLNWLERLLARNPELSQGESERASRPGVLHRLDKDTSGIILFSLAPDLHTTMLDCFRRRQIDKTYLALVAGEVSPHEGQIEVPLGRNSSGLVIPDERGRSACTSYRLLEGNQDWSLLECKPKTGRMHQIRVHLRHIGYPIAGDPLYGLANLSRSISPSPRLWLHAAGIDLPSQVSSELKLPSSFLCPLWEDLADHLTDIGGRFR